MASTGGNKSIVGLHSELTANATKFVNEYARADNAAKRHGMSIRNEMDKTMSAIQKKWSAPKLAIGLLKGMGLGGGMGLAHLLYDKISSAWNSAAEDAKAFQEALEKSVDAVRELQGARLGDLLSSSPEKGQAAVEMQLAAWKQQLTQFEAARKVAQADMVALQNAPFGTVGGTAFDPTKGRYGYHLPKEMHTRAQSAEQSAADEMNRLEKLIEEWSKKLTKSVVESSKKGQDAMAKWLKPFNDRIEQANKRHAEEAKKLRESVETPAEKFARRSSAIVALRTSLVDPIDDRTAKRGMAKAWADYQKDTNPFDDSRYGRYEKAADSFGKPDDMVRRGMGMGGSYAERGNKIETTLADIAQLIRTAISNGWSPGYTD